MSVVHVKICGVTTTADAEMCADAGASAIGVNLVPESRRYVDPKTARRIVDSVAGRTQVVLVVRDRSVDDMRRLLRETGAACLQLHGEEPPQLLFPLLPHAYKAIAVRTADDVARASRYPGEYLLVDTMTDDGWGGSGRSFDWSLVMELAKTRKLVLAGGLTPANVARAVRIVRPHTVDVASGVEKAGQPRQKDRENVRAFIRTARQADVGSPGE